MIFSTVSNAQFKDDYGLYKLAISKIKCEHYKSIDTIYNKNLIIQKIVFDCGQSVFIVDDYNLKIRSYAFFHDTGYVLNGEYYSISNDNYYYGHGHYKNGFLDGERILYRNRHLIYKYNFEDGILHGECITYHHNGKKFVVEEYKKGNKNGLSVTYDSMGRLLEKGKYLPSSYIDSTIFKEAQKDSTHRKFLYQDISPQFHWHKKGEWKYYNNGKLIRKELYRKKKLIKVINY